MANESIGARDGRERRTVYVPKWTTKVASLVLTGTAALLFVTYGFHLGRAMYFGIPASYVTVSPTGVLPYVLPGLLAMLLFAVLSVPAFNALWDLFRVFRNLQGSHGDLLATLLTAIAGSVSAVSLLCATFTAIETTSGLLSAPQAPSSTGIAVRAVVWALAALFFIMAVIGRKWRSVEGEYESTGNPLDAWRLMCRISYHLCKVVFWIAGISLVYRLFGVTLLLMALATPIVTIVIVCRSYNLTRRFQFRVIAYPSAEDKEKFEALERGWLKSTRWCAFFGVLVVAFVFVLSVLAGSESVVGSTAYAMVPESAATKIAFGHAEDDDVLMCVLDVYDSKTAVAVEATPVPAGGYSATVSDECFVVVDPSTGVRQERCEVTGMPAGDVVLLLFRKVGGR